MTATPPDLDLSPDARPPVDGAVRVVLAYPEEVTQDQVHMVRAVNDRLDVTIHHYRESTLQRTKRNQAEYVPSDADEPVPPELADALASAHVVLGLDLPSDMATVAPDLRWFQAIGAGVGHLRTVGFAPNVIVTNGAGTSAGGIAEFVIWRLLGTRKKADTLAQLQRDHRWVESEGFGTSFEGTTVAIVGFGAIGAAVAARLSTWGVKVIGVRAHPQPSPHAAEVVGTDRLFEVLGQADFVVLSAPGNEETREMFNAAAFAAMKPGAVFCNVARGFMINDADLIDALRSGHLGAAILDVVPNEPLAPDHPLWDAPNIYLSPHCAVALDRYATNVYELFADNLRRWFAGEPLRNVVDLTRGY